MYCPSCGKEINSGLSFCNFCGLRLTAAESDSGGLDPSSFKMLVGAVVAIPMIGLGIIIALMAVMKNGLGFRDEMIFAIVFLTFLLLFMAEIGMIWMMLSRTKKRKVVSRDDELRQLERAKIAEKILSEGQPLGFPAHVPSVTDHTTRTLNKSSREY